MMAPGGVRRWRRAIRSTSTSRRSTSSLFRSASTRRPAAGFRSPHGWPVDPAVEQAENPELAPLSELEPGARATIVRLAEHDGELLHWFYDQGLAPGVEIEVRDVQPAVGQFTVRLNGSEHAVGEKAAAGLFVRRAA